MRALCILVLAACGGGKGGNSVAAAFDRNVEVFCGQAHSCRAQFPTDAGFMFEDLFEDTEPACEANLRANSNVNELQASVDAGRIIYDAGDAADCIEFFEELSCDEFWGTFFDDMPMRPMTCETSFRGTVPTGGACTIDQDCAAMDGCNNVVDGMGTCGGGI